MLIGIDGNEANVKERVGVNIWAFEMLKSLAKIAKNNQNREKLHFVIYLSKSPLLDLPMSTSSWQYRVIRPAKFWTRWRLPLDLYFYKPRPNVFLSLSHYAPKWSPIPRIVCIMDLSFLKFPKAFKQVVLWQLKNWTKQSIKKASHVIAISEFTKQEIIKHYHYSSNKITVVYPGVSEVFKSVTSCTQGQTLQTLKKYGIRGKYILFVGTRQPKKNLGRLVEAFGLVRKNFPEVELVIAGKIWGQFVKDEIFPSIEGSHPSIKYVGFVPEENLPALMAGARVFVFPSLYEGFGIPAIEAMSIGVPVVASNISSLPEIIGDDGIFFNPLNVQEIASGIRKILSMSLKDRQEMIKKGMIRAKQFDWEKSAEKVLNILINER